LSDPVDRQSRAFSRANRMLNAADYRQVFADNRRSSDACFTVLAHRTGRDHARLGLAIAKKHARRAVDRNRIKRVTRESFRHSLETLAGYDLVILAKPGTVRFNNPQLTKSLQGHWRKITRPG
ncbi:MAG: ribonuclease P protein component, partial [bacterium]